MFIKIEVKKDKLLLINTSEKQRDDCESKFIVNLIKGMSNDRKLN